MKYISKYFKNKPISYVIITAAIAGLVLYTLYVFTYLKITGVYAVATIKDGTPTSEGIDFKYEFYYLGKKYDGVFTDIKSYKIGDKYFVNFSKRNPFKNLLRYNQPVPNCFKDSIFSFWKEIPECSTRDVIK